MTHLARHESDFLRILTPPEPIHTFSAMAPVFVPWEARFTLVQWDQPGAGATLAANSDDKAPLTYDRLARAFSRDSVASDRMSLACGRADNP